MAPIGKHHSDDIAVNTAHTVTSIRITIPNTEKAIQSCGVNSRRNLIVANALLLEIEIQYCKFTQSVPQTSKMKEKLFCINELIH